MKRRNQQGGYAILGVLIVFAIIGVLTTSFMTTDTPTGQPFVVHTQDRARQTVQALNLRTAETELMMRTEGRRPPIENLRRLMDDLSTRFNVGGRLFLDERDQLRVTTQLDPPRFREAFGTAPFR